MKYKLKLISVAKVTHSISVVILHFSNSFHSFLACIQAQNLLCALNPRFCNVLFLNAFAKLTWDHRTKTFKHFLFAAFCRVNLSYVQAKSKRLES